MTEVNDAEAWSARGGFTKCPFVTSGERFVASRHVDAAFTITLLGRMAAIGRDGRNLLPKQRKSRAILAVMAMSAPRPVLRTTLCKLLWSRRDDEQARASLRQAIHEISAALAFALKPVLRSDRTSIALDDEDIWADVFEIDRAAAPSFDPLIKLTTTPLLQELVGLDDAFDRWIETEQARLTRISVQLAEAALLTSGDVANSIARAKQILAVDNTNQQVHRVLIRGLAQAGDLEAAIAASKMCEVTLARHGQSPSIETRSLIENVRPRGADISTVIERPLAPKGTSLGVMPFRILDTTPGTLTWGQNVSIGLAEDITAALSRFRWFYLIASPSLAAVQAASEQDRPAILRNLQLDFLIDGSIQRSGTRVRVIAKLLDLRQRHPDGWEVAWSQRFDGNDADLLTLQDRIAAGAVAQVDPEMRMREGQLGPARAARDISAYHLTLRAIPAIYSLDETSFRSAGELLDSAIARDPDYATAHAWAAYWEIFLVGQGWSGDLAASMRRAGASAERAIELDSSDARALTIAGHVRAFIEHRADAAHALHDKAIQLNPSLPLAWALSGLARSYDSDHEEAIRRTSEARRLSPLDPHRFFFEGCEMVPNLALGNHERVVELARRALAHNPNFSSNHKVYLSALGHLGDEQEGGQVLTQLLDLEPGFRISSAASRSPFGPIDREHYLQGLRLAGLPE